MCWAGTTNAADSPGESECSPGHALGSASKSAFVLALEKHRPLLRPCQRSTFAVAAQRRRQPEQARLGGVGAGSAAAQRNGLPWAPAARRAVSVGLQVELEF